MLTHKQCKNYLNRDRDQKEQLTDEEVKAITAFLTQIARIQVSTFKTEKNEASRYNVKSQQ